MKKYLYPLNAIHKDGKVVLLYTLDELYEFIRKNERFCDTHIGWYFDWRGYSQVVVYNDWIVRDDRGAKVRWEDVPKRPYTYGSWYRKRQKELRHAADLGLPIPRTGCRKAGWKINHQRKKNGGKGVRIKVQQSKDDFAAWKNGR